MIYQNRVKRCICNINAPKQKYQIQNNGKPWKEQEIICFSICDPTNDSIIRIVKNALLIYDFTNKSISIIKKKLIKYKRVSGFFFFFFSNFKNLQASCADTCPPFVWSSDM